MAPFKPQGADVTRSDLTIPIPGRRKTRAALANPATMVSRPYARDVIDVVPLSYSGAATLVPVCITLAHMRPFVTDDDCA